MESFPEALQKTELFAGVEAADLPRLMSCLGAGVSRYRKNQPVFLYGERIDRFGVVLSGQVQVVRDDYYGNRNILAVFGPGELFAESFAFARAEALPVSVYAAEDVEALLIDSRRLTVTCAKACAFHSRLIRNLMEILAQKNVALTRKIEFLSKRTTREKLLAYLAAEAARAGSRRFSIDLDRQALADYLSVERSAMSAELSRLRRDGVLTCRKNRFELRAGGEGEADGGP
jgi:CRP/FNR family transcriptional regulator, dissimilatory nitrate respiration regulator